MNERDETPDFPPPLNLPKFDPVNAAHTLIEAAEDLCWDFDDKAAFLKRVKHIELGLSAEDEFSALLGWLGRCCLVHRNGQKWQSSFGGMEWYIPDLFTVFRRDSFDFSALIEVKTTKGSSLRLKEAYVQGLRKYSAIHSQPLLLAWRPRDFGLWLLFDPDHMQINRGKLSIDLETALKNNLLGCIAGDFSISPLNGAGLYFLLKRVSDKTSTSTGYSATFVYDDVSWKDAHYQTHENLPRSIKYMLLSV